MNIKKFILPIFIFVTAVAGWIYRKFYWCNILLPAAGEPKGAGDILELVPIVLMLLFCIIAFIAGLMCLFVTKYKNKKMGVFLLLLSILSIPIYLAVHSSISAICNSH